MVAISCTVLLIIVAAAGYTVAEKDWPLNSITADYLAANPVNEKTVTCKQAVGFLKGVIVLGNIVGRQARAKYYKILDGYLVQWLQQLESIGTDGDVQAALGAVLPALNGTWNTASTLHRSVSAQFYQLDARGAALLTKVTGNKSLGPAILRIASKVPLDIDKSSAIGSRRYYQQIARFEKVVATIEAALQDETFEVLKFSIQSAFRVIFADSVEVVQEFADAALRIHHESDVKIDAIINRVHCAA